MPDAFFSLSSNGKWIKEQGDSDEDLVTRSSRWPHPVLAVTARESTRHRAWVSTSSRALLEEVGTTLEREGARVVRTPATSSDSRLPQMIRGRWNGWRNVSSKAAARAGGLADEGSVLAETLEVLSGSMPRYADWLTEQIVIGNPQSILEVGAGTGTITECLARVGRVTAVEPASDSRAILERNTANLDNVSVVGRLEDCGPLERFDAIVLINVLEHIDTDVAFLTQLRDYLSPNGYIAVLSPAHNALYSKFDASIGHVRRYTRRRLELTLRHAGYRDANVRYFNFVGAFLWFAVNRLGGRSSATEGQTALYDRVIVPISRAVDRICIRPFGQSVVGVGRS